MLWLPYQSWDYDVSHYGSHSYDSYERWFEPMYDSDAAMDPFVAWYVPIDTVIRVPCTCWNIHSDRQWPCCDIVPIGVMYDIRLAFVDIVDNDGSFCGRSRLVIVVVAAVADEILGYSVVVDRSSQPRRNDWYTLPPVLVVHVLVVQRPL